MSTPPILIINATIFSPSPDAALVSDLAFWKNNTQEDHWPWPTDANYNPLATGWFPAAVPPGETSGDFATPPQPETIYYYCKVHPDRISERGMIQVVNSLP